MFKKNKSHEKTPLAKNGAVSVRLKLAWIVTFTIQAYFRRIYVESSVIWPFESKKSIQKTDWRNWFSNEVLNHQACREEGIPP